jgi:hypothetical protein
MVPAWPMEWFNRALQYAAYTQSSPTITILLSSFLSKPAANLVSGILIAICLVITIWMGRLWWKGKLNTMLAAGWCGVLTYFIHPHYIAYEQIAFLVPTFVWAAQQKRIFSWPMLVFWFGGLLFSWFTFFISRFNLLPVNANGWPVLLAAAWLAWIWADLRYTKGGNTLWRLSLDYLPKSK